MIVSFFDGRVRIRHEALKDPGSLAMVENFIKQQDGVRQITANPRTGSLLVLYDPEQIPRETLLTAAKALEEKLPASAVAKSCRAGGRYLSRRTEMMLLAGLYGGVVAGGFLNIRAHVIFATLFTALAGLHVYQRRRCL